MLISLVGLVANLIAGLVKQYVFKHNAQSLVVVLRNF
jgi:hypothetical protein